MVIPSRGRFDCRRTREIFSDPLLCVAASEEAKYRAANPGTRMLVHPDELHGLGAKRAWMMEHLQEQAVFFADDDVDRLCCLVGQSVRTYRDPQIVERLLEQSADVCRDLGTILWGYAHTVDTRHFRSYHPFAFSGYINGFAMGIIGRSIAFDPLFVTKSDVDFSLAVLDRYRIVFRDSRFAFRAHGWFRNRVGLAGIRTAEVEERMVRRLKAKWGPAVDVSHFARKGKGKHQNIRIHVQR